MMLVVVLEDESAAYAERWTLFQGGAGKGLRRHGVVRHGETG
jgi:hypothetical protein